ncbi:hypothetical protein ACSS6W_004565 [Trichoderma asperelloides]|uniref:Uncharacterized protein n=1 Tax=Trichoderma asperellum TaxID=101201 RepID=A0A6V8QWB3_TRIAP|nr:hypothetical protein TASIC1_0007039900 [Trichoderma asperellum]
MRSSAIIAAAAATLAGLASASPAHKFDKHAAHIAYTYPNGTFTKPFDVATNGKAQQLPSNNIVSEVFVAPPFDGRRYVLTSCSFQAPSNKSLGAVSIRKPTTVPVNPPAAIGYVTCNSN